MKEKGESSTVKLDHPEAPTCHCGQLAVPGAYIFVNQVELEYPCCLACLAVTRLHPRLRHVERHGPTFGRHHVVGLPCLDI